jgi:hypothetical protein
MFSTVAVSNPFQQGRDDRSTQEDHQMISVRIEHPGYVGCVSRATVRLEKVTGPLQQFAATGSF